MPRSREIFATCFRLGGQSLYDAEGHFSLDFHAVHDDRVFAPDVLKARQFKEQQSLEVRDCDFEGTLGCSGSLSMQSLWSEYRLCTCAMQQVQCPPKSCSFVGCRHGGQTLQISPSCRICTRGCMARIFATLYRGRWVSRIFDVCFMPVLSQQLIGGGNLQRGFCDTAQSVSRLLPTQVKHRQQIVHQYVQ